MKTFVFSALGLLLLCFLFVWLVSHVHYRIGDRHVRILLFRLCLRRIPLAKVSAVSKRRGPGLAEHWWSTLRPGHRELFIRRSRGLFRNVVITPRNRYTFKAELEDALRRVQGTAHHSEPDFTVAKSDSAPAGG